MDTTAVAIARGALAPRIRRRDVLMVAGLFGSAHALMPLIGAIAGTQVSAVVQRRDHWIAFGLLVVIGCTMFRRRDERADVGLAVTIGIAIATSIDALAIGITLPMLGAPIVLSIATIALVTAISSAAGLLAGHQFGARLGTRLGTAGGLVLVALGTKILIDHLATGR